MNNENELDRQIVYWDKVAHKRFFTHPVKLDRVHELLKNFKILTIDRFKTLTMNGNEADVFQVLARA